MVTGFIVFCVAMVLFVIVIVMNRDDGSSSNNNNSNKDNNTLFGIKEIKGLLFSLISNLFDEFCEPIIKKNISDDLLDICKERVVCPDCNKFYRLIEEIILSDEDFFSIYKSIYAVYFPECLKHFHNIIEIGQMMSLDNLFDRIMELYPDTFTKKILSSKDWQEIEKNILEQIEQVKNKH